MVVLDDFKLVLRDLARNQGFSLDEAVVLAHENVQAARIAILAVLVEFAESPFVTDAAKVMQVAWTIFGPSECLAHIFPPLPDRMFVYFITCELRENPDQFTDRHLSALSAMSRPKDVANAVELARRNRMKKEAHRLLANSRELEEDLKRVSQRISAHRFSPALNELLDKVAAEFGKGDGFDQSTMLKHLRTFFEHLHREAAVRLQTAKRELKDGTNLDQCQQVIDYLHRKNVLSENTRALGRALYGVLSEEGVHALQSTREYVRLCRNIVAEYGLILLYELHRQLQGSVTSQVPVASCTQM